MTIHDFDMARFLIGSEVEEVYAAGGVMVDPGIGEAGDVDTAVITLRFANGVIGTIDNSRQAVYGYDQRVEVFGSAAWSASPTTARSGRSRAMHDGVHGALPLYFFMERYTELLHRRDAGLRRVHPEGYPAARDGLDGRIPVVMGQAARKSYDENRPVRLSEIEASGEVVSSGRCRFIVPKLLWSWREDQRMIKRTQVRVPHWLIQTTLPVITRIGRSCRSWNCCRSLAHGCRASIVQPEQARPRPLAAAGLGRLRPEDDHVATGATAKA